MSKLCKTNPILSAVGGLQMNANSLIIKDYRKKDDFAVQKPKPNRSQFPKAILSAEKALNLARAAGDEELAQKIKERIKLYKQNKPSSNSLKKQQ